MAAAGPVHESSLGSVLRRRRMRCLVGREPQLRSFVSLLTAGGPAVVFVHGLGGIGKTSLLDLFAEAAATAGIPARRLDGRDLPVTRSALSKAVSGMPRVARQVLMVDGFERLEALESWFRDEAMARLPASTVVVLAGRKPPAPEWHADPGLREVLHVMELQDLDRDACEEYLQSCGVAPDLRERMVDMTHGHPLGLSLLTDVVTRGGRLDGRPLGREIVGPLLHRLLDVVPSTEQRQALAVCALARVTTESLLQAALGRGDASDLFDWLGGLSFVEAGESGLFPHDMARDALDADLRWRNPDSYETTFRRIGTYLVDQVLHAPGAGQMQAILDAKYMHRHQPVSRVWADWESFGRQHAEPAARDDHQAIMELVATWEGPESAAMAEHWWRRQPQGFAVVREADGGVRGVLGLVDLTAATPEDLAMDPGARAAWEHACRQAPPRPGELVTMSRFMIDREAYQLPSPTLNLAPVLSIQHFVQTPRLRCSFIAVADPERWAEYFTFFEIRRVPDGDFEVGSRPFGLFVRDFRQIPLEPWLRLMFERDLMGDQAVTSHAPTLPALLSHDEFEAAVREALRDLRRRDRLGANPLVTSRLLLAAGGGLPTAEAVRTLLVDAAARLREDPRDEKLFRAVDRTYLRPAPSQEKAAELLGVPLSTYKRHLRGGVARIVTDLWEREMSQD